MARILYVSRGYRTHDRRFLEKLADTSHDIWFLPCAAERIRYEPRPVPPRVRALPVLSERPLPWSPQGWMAALVRFRRLVRQIKPDLVHAGPVHTGGFLAALARVRPLLVMSWGSDVYVPPMYRWLRGVARFTLHRADMVFVDCQTVRQHVMELVPRPAEEIICFPWGIDLRHFYPRAPRRDLRQALQWQQARVVISTRGFEPIYGTLVFLEAVDQVMRRFPDVRVLMLGDGTLRPQVEAFIRQRGLSERIHLPGQVSPADLPDYFNSADLYVSATYSDGSSVSLLEAMACGLPVVVNDRFGNREWVTPSTNGWLFPAGDAKALANTIQEALEQPEQRRAMRQANVTLARERADWERNFPQLLQAYARLLQGHRGNGSGA